MYKSLNKIVDDFKLIVEHHKLLGSKNFFFGDPEDLAELNLQYPHIIMQSIPFQTSENSIDYKFRLYFMDLVDEDLSNYRDVLSDQIQIFNDILNRLENYSDYYTVSTKNSINPFNQKFDDYVGGIWVDIQYTTGRMNGECDAPFDDFLFDSDGNIITESNRFNILLNDLADISLENLQNGQSLVYSGGTWVNSDADNLEYWRLNGNELTTLEEYLIKVNDIQVLNDVSVEGNLEVLSNTILNNVKISGSTEVNYVKYNNTEDNQIIFNSNGVLTGNTDFTYDSETLNVNNILTKNVKTNILELNSGTSIYNISTILNSDDNSVATTRAIKNYVDDNFLSNDVDYVNKEGDTINGDLIIEGNLYVSGDTTTVNSENLNIKDNVILLNSGETGSGVILGTSGIEIDRGTLDNQKLIFNESDDKWKIGTDTLENISTENYVDTNVYNSENTQLIFNNNGTLSGDSLLTWNGVALDLGNQQINKNGYIKMSSRIESGFFTNYTTGTNIKFLGRINEGFTFGNRWAVDDHKYFTNVDGDGNWYIYNKTDVEQTPDTNFKLKVDGNTLFTDTYIDSMSGSTENFVVGVDGDGKLYRTAIDVNQEEFDLIDFIILSGVSENQSFQIPAKFKISSIILEETSGSTISGISIGTNSGSSEVVNNENLSVGELKEVEVGVGIFSIIDDTTLYIHSTDWTSEFNVHIKIEKFTE